MTLPFGRNLLLIAGALLCSNPAAAQDAPAKKPADQAQKGAQGQPSAEAQKAAMGALVDWLVRSKRSAEAQKLIQSGFAFPQMCKTLYSFSQKHAALTAKIRAAGADAGDAKALPAKDAQDAMAAILTGVDVEANEAKLVAHAASVKRGLKGVGDNISGMRKGQFLAYMQAQLRTGARFIGQYAPMRMIGPDIFDLACEVLDSSQLPDPSMRGTLVIAMRDFVKQPPLTKAQIDRMKGYIEDEFEDIPVIRASIGLLAYAGHDEIYKKRVAELQKAVEGAKAADAIEHYSELSELQSIAERNSDAAMSYSKLIEAAISAGLDKRVIASHHYNHACALEKAGKRAEAVAALDRALTADKTSLSRATLWLDRDIAEIRKTEDFTKLVEKHELKDPRKAKKSPAKQAKKEGAGQGGE